MRAPKWISEGSYHAAPVALSELEVVREMARCLRLIGEGQFPN